MFYDLYILDCWVFLSYVIITGIVMVYVRYPDILYHVYCERQVI